MSSNNFHPAASVRASRPVPGSRILGFSDSGVGFSARGVAARPDSREIPAAAKPLPRCRREIPRCRESQNPALFRFSKKSGPASHSSRGSVCSSFSALWRMVSSSAVNPSSGRVGNLARKWDSIAFVRNSFPFCNSCWRTSSRMMTKSWRRGTVAADADVTMEESDWTGDCGGSRFSPEHPAKRRVAKETISAFAKRMAIPTR